MPMGSVVLLRILPRHAQKQFLRLANTPVEQRPLLPNDPCSQQASGANRGLVMMPPKRQLQARGQPSYSEQESPWLGLSSVLPQPSQQRLKLRKVIFRQLVSRQPPHFVQYLIKRLRTQREGHIAQHDVKLWEPLRFQWRALALKTDQGRQFPAFSNLHLPQRVPLLLLMR